MYRRIAKKKKSKNLFLGSSEVEQTTVNRWVAGSIPARGAILRVKLRMAGQLRHAHPELVEGRLALPVLRFGLIFILWGGSSAWIERPPVTRKVAGSSPVHPAIFCKNKKRRVFL
jgi:hypothetical protein